jgi:hypothetical protein
MNIELHRRFFKDTYTVGRLFIDGLYTCDTLEDKVRDLKDINHDGDFDDPGEGKVYGQTAIPCGKYKVGLYWWKKHQRFVPILKSVPGFTGILIHSGATPKDTEGCILVGQNKEKGRLVNSPYYATTITQKVKEAIDRKETIFITVKE